jgi:hypothetical protein
VFHSLEFLREHRKSNAEWLDITSGSPDGASLAIGWIPEKWWKLVTGCANRRCSPKRVNRRQFEVCVFSQIMSELKVGDLCIEGADQYADYRDQLVTWDEYHEMVGEYAEQVGLETDPVEFVNQLRNWLARVAALTDTAFPQNREVTIEDGEPKVKWPGKKASPAGLRSIKKLISQRIERVNILDVLADTENWVGWTKFFGPLSGYDARVSDPRER